MPDIQDQLRRELAVMAERVQPEMVRPLRAPRAQRRRSRLIARHGRAMRLLVPAAAAAAVIAVVASVTVASGPAKGGHFGNVGGRRAGMPPYYVTLFNPLGTVVVHDSATGTVLDSVKLPLNLPKGVRLVDAGGAVSAAGDGRNFAVATETTQAFAGMECQFFRLHLGPGGRSVHVTRIKVPSPPGAGLPMMALSPHSTKLAVNYGMFPGTSSPLEIVNLVTGSARAWTWRESATVTPLSWADDRNLALDWVPNTAPSGGGNLAAGGLRLLDTAAAGHDVFAASRQILPGAIRLGDIEDAWIMPGGRTAVALVQRSGSNSVVELAAGTGRVVRRLYGPVSAKPWSCSFLVASSSADHLLAFCPHHRRPYSIDLGRIDNGRFTRLPTIVGPFSVTAW